MAMKSFASETDLFSLSALTNAPDYGASILRVLTHLGDAPDAASAVEEFQQILQLFGADAGVFLSFVRDDATRSSYRWLLACDALWAVEYTRRAWHDHDPWLRHALHGTEPIRGTELNVLPDEEEFAATSATLGFASAVIVPAPTNAGASRVGMLCLGSHNLGFFEDDGAFAVVRVLARALAMELHRWHLNFMRSELLVSTRISAAELDLLRHEQAGHTSKHIGAALNIEAKTVDCRFQKLCAKLNAPDRRTAARLARLYGLI